MTALLSAVIPAAVPALFNGFRAAYKCNRADESSVHKAQGDVMEMSQTIGNVAYAVALFFGVSKLLALGYTNTAYAALAVGVYTNVPAGLVLGAAYVGYQAYTRLAPVAAQVFQKNLSLIASKQTAIGAVFAFASIAIVSTAAFEKAKETWIGLEKLPGFNLVHSLLHTVSLKAAQCLISKEGKDEEADPTETQANSSLGNKAPSLLSEEDHQ